MFTIWVLYHSIVNVGQRFYAFGWESQILETGFLALLACPVFTLSPIPQKSPMPWISIWGLKWLLVRIMIGAGLIKIRGDQCWKDFTCMDYYYETQPLPNPISYYLHHCPDWMHATETFVNHVVELILPFVAFLPSRRFGIMCGVVQILFQMSLILCGNFCFLNWLTIAPSLAFFDDKSLSVWFSKKTLINVATLQKAKVAQGKIRRGVNVVIALVLCYLSVPVVVNLLSSRQIMNISYDSFRVVNTYGAFGSVARTRKEVILSGSHTSSPSSENVTWLEYDFKCKPGQVDKRPCLVSPYHYRLDWLMWLASFQTYEQNPWLLHLTAQLLTNQPSASALINRNPFEGKKPPRYVKADLFHYEYTKMGSEEAGNGDWYTRKYVKNYFPPLDLQTLKPFIKQFGWKPLKKK